MRSTVGEKGTGEVKWDLRWDGGGVESTVRRRGAGLEVEWTQGGEWDGRVDGFAGVMAGRSATGNGQRRGSGS